MSREQWGHGYWRGVEDAQTGKVKSDFPTEVKFWIANMCRSNMRKTYDRTLFPVREWIAFAHFCGLSTAYARKVYNHILNKNWYEFKPSFFSWCYVSGAAKSDWSDDYFVIPISDYELDEWEHISDQLVEEVNFEANGL